jgi:hypothetical protein
MQKLPATAESEVKYFQRGGLNFGVLRKLCDAAASGLPVLRDLQPLK